MNLRGCKGVTDEAIDKLIAGCKNLATVDLTGCVGVSEKTKKAMAAVCEVVDEPPEDDAEEKTSSDPKKEVRSPSAGFDSSDEYSDCSDY